MKSERVMADLYSLKVARVIRIDRRPAPTVLRKPPPPRIFLNLNKSLTMRRACKQCRWGGNGFSPKFILWVN